MKHGINRLKHPVMQRQEYTNWLMNRTENITLRHITMTLQLLHQYYINICHNWDILQLLVSVLLSDPPVYTAVAVSLSSGVTLSHKALSTLSQKSETVAENGDCRRIRRQSHFSATVWTGLNVMDCSEFLMLRLQLQCLTSDNIIVCRCSQEQNSELLTSAFNSVDLDEIETMDSGHKVGTSCWFYMHDVSK